jgi:hypothetical protein
MRKLNALWLPVAAAVALLAIPAQQATAQCPAVGLAPTCNIIITLGPSGATVVVDSPTPYDGVEDVTVGVINNSGATLPSIALSGPGIFGFDGDGLCTVIAGGCSYPNPTGYEGPITTFSVTDFDNGVVNFVGGLPNGQSTYFSLEGDPSVAGGIIVGTTVPEPASMTLLATGLFGLAGAARRRLSARRDS